MDWEAEDWDQLDGWKKDELKSEIIRLRAAIRKHRDEKAHDRCWLDDQELYQTLPEADPGDLALPPKEEFIENCHRYWEHRRDPSVTFIRQKDLDRVLGPMSVEEAERIARNAGIIDENDLTEAYTLPHSD